MRNGLVAAAGPVFDPVLARLRHCLTIPSSSCASASAVRRRGDSECTERYDERHRHRRDECHIVRVSGTMIRNKIRIVVGVEVTVEMMLYDLRKGARFSTTKAGPYSPMQPVAPRNAVASIGRLILDHRGPF